MCFSILFWCIVSHLHFYIALEETHKVLPHIVYSDRKVSIFLCFRSSISRFPQTYIFTFIVYFWLITLGAVQEVSHTSIFFFPQQEGAAAQNTTNAGTLNPMEMYFQQLCQYIFLKYRCQLLCYISNTFPSRKLTNGKVTGDRCR